MTDRCPHCKKPLTGKRVHDCVREMHVSPDPMTVPGLDPDSLTELSERLATVDPLHRGAWLVKLCREASAALPALQDANREALDEVARLHNECWAAHRQLADIEALRALSEAASPGEWRTWNDGHVGSPSAHIGGIFMPTTGSDFDRQMPDARFVAAACNAVRAALSVPAVPVDEEGAAAFVQGAALGVQDALRDLTARQGVSDKPITVRKPAAPSPGPLNKEERDA